MKNLLLLLGLSIMLNASEGSELFKKCAACHGLNGEKPALGKSEIISSWKSEKTVAALTEYKAGKRNIKGMGPLMKSQTAALSEKDIKTLGDYIATLKK
jgi:cytochrome c